MNKSAIQFGLIAGLVISIINAMIYFVNYELLADMWVGLGMLLMVIVLAIVGAVRSKKEFGPFDLKQAFIVTFLICMSLMVVVTLYNIIMFQVVDPTFGERITDVVLNNTEQMLVRFNMPEADIEEQLAAVAESTADQYTMGGMLKGLLIGSLIYAMFSIIIALIIRSKKD
ncbi:MAG: amino acid transporter [Flavobacteriales bacterium]|jgi:amino acid transporter